MKFTGANGLAKVIRDDPALTACVSRRAYAFGVGALPPQGGEWSRIEKRFADTKYNFPLLLREIALSDLFFAVAPAKAAN